MDTRNGASFEGASSFERLVYASKTDNEDVSRIVLEKEANEELVNGFDNLGLAPLHHAVITLSAGVFEQLLDNEATDIDLPTRSDTMRSGHTGKSTPLHLACTISNPKARVYFVEELLEAGADPRLLDALDRTPIAVLNSEPVPAQGSEARQLWDRVFEALDKAAGQLALTNALTTNNDNNDNNDSDSGSASD